MTDKDCFFLILEFYVVVIASGMVGMALIGHAKYHWFTKNNIL
jgi:hypothetical protein